MKQESWGTMLKIERESQAAKNAQKYLSKLTSGEVEPGLNDLSDDEIIKLANIAAKPTVRLRVNHGIAPFGLNLTTSYGTVQVDDGLRHIDHIYINGQAYSADKQGLDAIAKLTGSEDDVQSILGKPQGRQKRGRKTRMRRTNENLDYKTLQDLAYQEVSKSGLSYDSLFDDLDGLLAGGNVNVQDVSDEIFANKVPEEDLAHFLVYDSNYKQDVLAAAYGDVASMSENDYHFKKQKQDDSFAGRLLAKLGEKEGLYDKDNGVLRIGKRDIVNLPNVDDKGVFESNGHKYLPYHIGYFTANGTSRVNRLRVIDPVQNAIDACALQYKNSKGPIRFKTLLDVTRNLPDFDHHPYGKEILDTMKKKVVIDKAYGKTNSLLADYAGDADDLGAVALTMLDDDAKGLIDPLGTSNGANMGKIFYLTEKSQINPDGTLTPGGDKYSPVGKILAQKHVDRDNFNRNQMSFNAFLTSTDVKTLKVAYAEFAMWNSEDAVVMTKKGAETAFGMEKKQGDKIEDFHGNKSTISLIADPDMPESEAEQKHVEWAKAFATMNPDLDLIVSPVSLASRLNMGVPHEALTGERKDLYLPDGNVIPNGICEVTYMSLPQTAEHKSKDYSLEGDGRRYSTLIHYALASKVGEELYDKALIDDETVREHVDSVDTTFNRLGVSFKDPNKMIADGNVNMSVDSPSEVMSDELSFKHPAAIRDILHHAMKDGSVNINLGDQQVVSPLTGKPITDSFGENVLPIKVNEGSAIPYRYNDVFKAISLGNSEKLQKAYDRAIACDYRNLTKKDNILKNVETMRFKREARTDVLIPDPTLPLGDVRSNTADDRVIIHRDPVIQSGNAISMTNVHGAAPNTTQINPLIDVMMDADHDGDTVGNNGYSNLDLTDSEKDEFFKRSNVTEQVNQYGRVFLETNNSHFVAAAKANKININNINFDDGKTNQELVDDVDKINRQIIASPNSYGAYALNFTNDETLKTSLGRLAQDGIKGDEKEIDRVFDQGYTEDENRAILKALIAKSEWTGLAGATTNNLISGISGEKFDPKLTRVAMDLTHTMTQSVLQMKKNAEKLPEIDEGIRKMKAVMAGKFNTEASRQMLKSVTHGLIEEEAVDEFVNRVAEKQTEHPEKFGYGVINHTQMNTTKMAFSVQKDDLAEALESLSGANLQM